MTDDEELERVMATIGHMAVCAVWMLVLLGLFALLVLYLEYTSPTW